jgi:hypothetical protein
MNLSLERLVSDIHLEKVRPSSYKVPTCMKRLVGSFCCLVLLFASAAWALEKCQTLAAHHDGHEHSESVTHADNHGLDLPRDQAPVIHCVNSGEIPNFIFQPSPRIAPLVVTYKILPSSFVPVMAEANGWITYSAKRPPGCFLAAVSPYLSLSVLRF